MAAFVIGLIDRFLMACCSRKRVVCDECKGVSASIDTEIPTDSDIIKAIRKGQTHGKGWKISRNQ
jgi:hypothetical protein